MTILEHMAADAKQAQARQAALWNGKIHPTRIFVPDHHGYQSSTTRGLRESSISHPTIALAVDYGL
jgi:hypothetical protein